MAFSVIVAPHCRRCLLYVMVVVIVLLCTIISIEKSATSFNLLRGSEDEMGEFRSSAHGDTANAPVDSKSVKLSTLGKSDSTAPLMAPIGSLAWWKLDGVRNSLKERVQVAEKLLQESLDTFVSSTRNGDWIGRKTSRAIIIYLPPDSEHFLLEVKAMYLSVAYMRTFQPDTIKTDYIIYTPENAKSFLTLRDDMGCSVEARKSFDDPETCIVIPFVPLKERVNELNFPEPLIDYDGIVNSILIMADFKFSDVYQYAIKTDIDTFLTPGFADYLPPQNVAIATGRGGYGSVNANNHLKWMIEHTLSLKFNNADNVGTTWYGNSEVLVNAAKVSMEAMRWLDTQEFSEFEKEHAGTDGWPNWHWPVLSMYGGHVAVNQIPPEHRITNQDGVMEMDFGSAHTLSPLPDYAKHIHCWHTQEFFSKFQFHSGQYKNLDLTPYLEMQSAAAYSGVIAISSDRLTYDEIKMYASDPESMKNKDWVRLVGNN